MLPKTHLALPPSQASSTPAGAVGPMLSVIRLTADASAMQMRCCSPAVCAILTQSIKNPVFPWQTHVHVWVEK